MLISGIESKLVEAKFNYFVESHRFAPVQIENSPDTLMDRQVEGMISSICSSEKVHACSSGSISDITNAAGVNRIVIDNYAVARAGLNTLRGHSRIAFFKGPEITGAPKPGGPRSAGSVWARSQPSTP